MELSTLLSSLFFFLLVINYVQKKSRNQLIKNFPLPPGPWKLPIIGSMHHVIGTLPHRLFRDLSNKHGPVMHLKVGEIDQIIISSPEAAKEILKTKDLNFASRPQNLFTNTVVYGSSSISLTPYGDYWKQLRKIAALELFSVKRVKTFSSIREEEVLSLVQQIVSSSCSGRGSPVNLTKLFLLLANTIASRATYGEKCKHQERFISAVIQGSKLLVGFNIADLYPSVKFLDVLSGMKFHVNRIHHEIDGILDEIIGEHLAKSSSKLQGEKESLLDVLLRTREHGDLDIPLTTNNIKAVILEIFAAGTETTANVMTWAMAELMRNPEVMEKAQAEVRLVVLLGAGKENIGDNLDKLNYLKLVIKETLRLHPPTPLLLPRVCAETCEVAGFTIPARSTVLINAWAMGRDPKYWHDAESFKPERFDHNADQNFDAQTTGFEYLPFGGGRRVCPGIGFGLATVELALAQLLYHFDWELPGGMQPQDLDMTEYFRLSVGRKLDLLLLAKPRTCGEEGVQFNSDGLDQI